MIGAQGHQGPVVPFESLEEIRRERDRLRSELQSLTRDRYGDPGLQMLFLIQEALPEVGICSGLRLGAEVLLDHFKARGRRIDELLGALLEAHEGCRYGLPHCTICKVLEVEQKRRKEGK